MRLGSGWTLRSGRGQRTVKEGEGKGEKEEIDEKKKSEKKKSAEKEMEKNLARYRFYVLTRISRQT